VRPDNALTIQGPRLPYHPAIEQRFGVDQSGWRALVDAIFPTATQTESVILALSYCKARRLDPFKRVVHIVPIWSKSEGRMVDTVWPGIGELRTTAHRTGEYAGRDETLFGETETMDLGGVSMTFPAWAQVTLYRIVKGQRVAFTGPKVLWLETYATAKKDTDAPNDIWRNRPFGQIEKCAEAAALRAAFPEEVGGDMIPEEVERGTGPVVAQVIETQHSKSSRIAEEMASPKQEAAPPSSFARHESAVAGATLDTLMDIVGDFETDATLTPEQVASLTQKAAARQIELNPK
jgi:phage recombination protein Bet